MLSRDYHHFDPHTASRLSWFSSPGVQVQVVPTPLMSSVPLRHLIGPSARSFSDSSKIWPPQPIPRHRARPIESQINSNNDNAFAARTGALVTVSPTRDAVGSLASVPFSQRLPRDILCPARGDQPPVPAKVRRRKALLQKASRRSSQRWSCRGLCRGATLLPGPTCHSSR
jgi:hypothetical protein